MPTAAQTIAGWTSAIRIEDVPSEVAEHAKLHILDTLGCGLAATATATATEGRSTMAELGGAEQATVIGLADRLPAANAAFANAMLCHGLDFDDTHSDSVSHVSTVVTPAALAAGEQYGASGRDVLAAIVAGNEVVCRVGMAASGQFHARGFHPTAICGVFGATATVSRLAGLDADAATRALGIAGSMASGVFAYLADGTPTKPIHPAWAAHGATREPPSYHGAAAHIDSREFGLYHAYLAAAEAVDRGQLPTRSAGSPRMPTSPSGLPPCTALGATGRRGRRRADEITEVVSFRAGVSLVLEPQEQKKSPRSEYEGKFSLQYSVASMLVRGHVAVSDFTDEAIADPAVLAVAQKVRYETPEYPSYPQASPAVCRPLAGVDLAGDFPFQRGPRTPRRRVRAKFRGNAGLALADGALDALEEAILTLEDHADLARRSRRCAARGARV
jgi:2-methylcitrate dehydratase PrpD